VISRDAVCARSPARGLSPQRIGELLYRRARRDMEPDEYFTEADVSATGGDDGAVEAFGKWGIIVRPDDYAAADRWQPPVLEFHLTPRDLEREWSMRAMPCELVVHVPEYCSDEELLDLCVPDLRKRRHAIRFVVGVLDRVRSIAAYFRGRAKVVVHPGGATLGEVSAGARARMRAIFTESYHELRGEAERLGLTILPENLPPFPWYFGGQWRSQVFVDPREVLEFAHREGAPICLDTSHAQLACTVLERAMVPEAARLRPFVRHLHVADAAGTNGEGVQIGEGDVDFRGLLEAYERYDESWVPEIWQGHHNGHEGFRTAIRRLMELRASRCAS
jgi:N-acetylneuraminate synthase